jgi:L-fuculose-phosphate aldolase
MAEDITQLVAVASRILAASGQGDLIWGHASIRDPDGRGVWIKEAEYGMEEITPDLVHLVAPDGMVLEGKGSRHNEYPIHTEIIRARPDVGAVVHTHAPHAVALAAAGVPVRPVSHAGNLFVAPEVPRFTLTADLIMTQALGEHVAATLGDANALFLVNHGIVAVGPDIQTATVTAILLEQACEQQLRTDAFGGSPTWSGAAESASKREHIYNARALSSVWDYLRRTVAMA